MVNSLQNNGKNSYRRTFLYNLGSSQQALPYQDNTLDFVACSCVVQHLNSFAELKTGLTEIARVLKPSGQLYLMFKAGANDQILTHFNAFYGEIRSFRVFEPEAIISVCRALVYIKLYIHVN